jgi:hypothetical protein
MVSVRSVKNGKPHSPIGGISGAVKSAKGEIRVSENRTLGLRRCHNTMKRMFLKKTFFNRIFSLFISQLSWSKTSRTRTQNRERQRSGRYLKLHTTYAPSVVSKLEVTEEFGQAYKTRNNICLWLYNSLSRLYFKWTWFHIWQHDYAVF